MNKLIFSSFFLNKKNHITDDGNIGKNSFPIFNISKIDFPLIKTEKSQLSLQTSIGLSL
jgi:hypothetical protein